MPNKLDPKTLETELRQMIAKIAEVDESKVTLDADFVEDLGMDSMMALEILSIIEKKYNVKLSEEYLSKIATLRSLIDIALEVLQQQ